MKRFSIWLLEVAERFFLWAHHWDRREDEYYPPDDYPSNKEKARREAMVAKPYVRSHAVNSQKQYVYNPMHGGKRVDPDLRKKKGLETL